MRDIKKGIYKLKEIHDSTILLKAKISMAIKLIHPDILF